jgi:hypothetical protein
MNPDIQSAVDARAAETGASRVTAADIDAEIASVNFFTAAQGEFGARMYEDGTTPMPKPSTLDLLTLCVLVLKNGFTVVGKSACADPRMFDAEIGRKVALNDAKGQCWALLGFRLRDAIENAEKTGQPVIFKRPAF